MKKLVKTASIVTSGIIVGALVRKFAFHGVSLNRKHALDSIKSVKDVFNKNSISEDLNNYFI
jgi:hypothetical protein